MFIYICQAPTHFQFTKKVNNCNSQKVYLFARLLLFAGGLWSFPGDLWLVAGGFWLLVVFGCLLII